MFYLVLFQVILMISMTFMSVWLISVRVRTVWRESINETQVEWGLISNDFQLNWIEPTGGRGTAPLMIKNVQKINQLELEARSGFVPPCAGTQLIANKVLIC